MEGSRRSWWLRYKRCSHRHGRPRGQNGPLMRCRGASTEMSGLSRSSGAVMSVLGGGALDSEFDECATATVSLGEVKMEVLL